MLRTSAFSAAVPSEARMEHVGKVDSDARRARLRDARGSSVRLTRCGSMAAG